MPERKYRVSGLPDQFLTSLLSAFGWVMTRHSLDLQQAHKVLLLDIFFFFQNLFILLDQTDFLLGAVHPHFYNLFLEQLEHEFLEQKTPFWYVQVVVHENILKLLALVSIQLYLIIPFLNLESTCLKDFLNQMLKILRYNIW